MTDAVSTVCAICAQAEGRRYGDALRPLLGRCGILASSGQAVAFPSLGAVTVGHVIVCPRSHHRSWAACPDKVVADGQALTANLKRRLSLLGPVHEFEHGNGAASHRVACSVEHAHLHLVPAPVDLHAALARYGPWIPVGKGDTRNMRAIVGTSEYLVYRAPAGAAQVWVSADADIPSQLLRRALVDALGRPDEWNWRDHPAVDRVDATLSAFGTTGMSIVS
jgi:ATP adenylyltransferase